MAFNCCSKLPFLSETTSYNARPAKCRGPRGSAGNSCRRARPEARGAGGAPEDAGPCPQDVTPITGRRSPGVLTARSAPLLRGPSRLRKLFSLRPPACVSPDAFTTDAEYAQTSKNQLETRRVFGLLSEGYSDVQTPWLLRPYTWTVLGAVQMPAYILLVSDQPSGARGTKCSFPLHARRRAPLTQPLRGTARMASRWELPHRLGERGPWLHGTPLPSLSQV